MLACLRPYAYILVSTCLEEEDDDEEEDEGEDKDHVCPYAHMIVSLCFIRVSLCLNACVLMLL